MNGRGRLAVVVGLALAGAPHLAPALTTFTEEDPPDRVTEARCLTEAVNAGGTGFAAYAKDGSATYKFKGVCGVKFQRKQGSFDVPYEIEAEWKAATRTAFETARIYNLGSILPDTFVPGTSETYTAYLARYFCDDDPWRNAQGRCGLEAVADPGGLRQLFPNIDNPPYPPTKHSVDGSLRERLAKDFLKATTTLGKVDPGLAVTKPGVTIGGSSLTNKAKVLATSSFRLGLEETPEAKKARYGAAYSSQAVGSIKRKSSKSVSVNVTNNGTLPWTTTEFSLGYHWYKGSELVVQDGAKSSLPKAVGLNESVVVAATINAPTDPGTYTLKWDMAHGAKYFSKAGVPTGNQEVEVK